MNLMLEALKWQITAWQVRKSSKNKTKFKPFRAPRRARTSLAKQLKSCLT